jgi:hypothetical protein
MLSARSFVPHIICQFSPDAVGVAPVLLLLLSARGSPCVILTIAK